MLDEIKSGGSSSEARYRAALDGQSLGTHSSGSSAHAVAIKPAAEGAGAQGGAAPAAGERKR